MNQTNQKSNPARNARYIVLFVFVLLLSDVWVVRSIGKESTVEHNAALQNYTVSQLATFDGSDATKPVYLALDGYVYDVTTGRDTYYAPSKPYHMLAGTDASTLLHIVGAEIITRKYKVVGRLIL